VFASEHSGVSLLCTWSISYTVMETLEDGIKSIVEDYWRRFNWFVTRIESIIWSIFTVKVIDYRFRFLLSLIDLVDPQRRVSPPSWLGAASAYGADRQLVSRR